MENLIKERLYSITQDDHAFIPFMILILILDSLVFILPYCLKGYTIPVGWDTPWYIRNMRLIEEQGVFSLFTETREINFFCILEYSFASTFGISYMTTETLFPIIIALLFPFVNFQIVKRFTDSWKLSFVAMALTIIDYNVVRMTIDLHRNLFCLLLSQVGVLLILPRLLKKGSKKDFFVFVVLMTVAGLSQIETFSIATFMIFVLFLLYLKKRSFKTAKMLLLCSLVPALIVLVIEAPYLPDFMGGHIVFTPSKWWYRPNFIPHPWCYLASFGIGLIPLYIRGMYDLLKKTSKNLHKHQHLLLFLWNAIVTTGSFLPMFGVTVPGWRFLILVSVPPVAALGFGNLFLEKDSFTKKKALIATVLISITLIAIISIMNKGYRPWISKDEYRKLMWIKNGKHNNLNMIFVLCFDYGWQTSERAKLYRNWIWGIVGTRTKVYFGDVKFLTEAKATDFKNPFMNSTSHVFWNEIESFTLDNTQIYTIEEWYNRPLNETALVEVETGIYYYGP